MSQKSYHFSNLLFTLLIPPSTCSCNSQIKLQNPVLRLSFHRSRSNKNPPPAIHWKQTSRLTPQVFFTYDHLSWFLTPIFMMECLWQLLGSSHRSRQWKLELRMELEALLHKLTCQCPATCSTGTPQHEARLCNSVQLRF